MSLPLQPLDSSSGGSKRAPLTYKKMFGQCWDDAIGKVVFSASCPDVALGRVQRVQFSNMRGALLATVRFEDGSRRDFPFGPDSPLLAVAE